MQNLFSTVVISALALGVIAVGCDKPQAKAPADNKNPTPAAAQAAVPAGFVIDKAPDSVKDLAVAMTAGIADGDTVVVRGIVGGNETPFVNNRAVVQIIDPSVITCDKMSGDSCKTPWDACCHQDDAKAKGATVQVLDTAGNPLKGTLEGVGGMKPLSEVVVRGKARKEGGKTLVIDADQVYIKPRS